MRVALLGPPNTLLLLGCGLEAGPFWLADNPVVSRRVQAQLTGKCSAVTGNVAQPRLRPHMLSVRLGKRLQQRISTGSNEDTDAVVCQGRVMRQIQLRLPQLDAVARRHALCCIFLGVLCRPWGSSADPAVY